MMCIACQQDAMWFAYLQRKGFITADGYPAEQPASVVAGEPLEPAPVAADVRQETLAEAADKSEVSGNDPAP
jgi:hypothetical protein